MLPYTEEELQIMRDAPEQFSLDSFPVGSVEHDAATRANVPTLEPRSITDPRGETELAEFDAAVAEADAVTRTHAQKLNKSISDRLAAGDYYGGGKFWKRGTNDAIVASGVDSGFVREGDLADYHNAKMATELYKVQKSVESGAASEDDLADAEKRLGDARYVDYTADVEQAKGMDRRTAEIFAQRGIIQRDVAEIMTEIIKDENAVQRFFRGTLQALEHVGNPFAKGYLFVTGRGSDEEITGLGDIAMGASMQAYKPGDAGFFGNVVGLQVL